MTLKFCANLKWLFTEVDFEARFAAAAQAGFTAVEYSSPYRYSVRLLRQLLSDNGLQQILINVPTGPPGSPEAAGIACHPGAAPQFRDDLRRALDYAVDLNSSFVHVMAGCLPAGVTRERALGTLRENLGWATEHVAGSPIRLLVEAQNSVDRPGYLLGTQEEAAALVQGVGSEALGVLFDVYHCAMAQGYAQGSVVTRLAALRPWIAHVQVADPPNRTEPGSGVLEWHSIFEQLRTEYDGWIGCEYRPAGTTAAGLEWISRLGLDADVS